MDAKYVKKRIARMYPPEQGWLYATEVPTVTGALGDKRIIDAFAMSAYPSKGFQRTAYEIKVSRGDWITELKDPMKKMQAYLLSNMFWFALAPGVLHQSDFKEYRESLRNTGIMELHEDGTVLFQKKPHKRQAWAMPEPFIASFSRCVRDQGLKYWRS